MSAPEFDAALAAARQGEIATESGASQPLAETLEQIAEYGKDAPQRLLDKARSQFLSQELFT